METTYVQKLSLGSVTPAALCDLFQQMASGHLTSLGIGFDEMRQQGLLWMIVKQKLVFYRCPTAGEMVTAATWLSKVQYGMYLRQYEIRTTAGEVICRAAATWTLVDAEKRTLSSVTPVVPLHQEEAQLAQFSLLRSVKTTQTCSFTVPAVYLDQNNHMNNARYFDAVAPILPEDRTLRTAQVDYHAEAREGEILAIGYARDGDTLLIQAQGDRGLCFRMRLEYV